MLTCFFAVGHHAGGREEIVAEEDRSKLEFFCEDQEEELFGRLYFYKQDREGSFRLGGQIEDEVRGDGQGRQNY